MDFNEKLKWRYATKHFDSSKKISDQKLSELLDSIRLSASSFGLEPYKILVISNPELREKLSEASWRQPQIVDASHLLVFCVNPEISVPEIEKFLRLTAEQRQIPIEALEDYKGMMVGQLTAMSAEVKECWVTRQAYIALGFGLIAAAEMGIDSCPMEGFDTTKYDELLNLGQWKSKVLLPIGFRSDDDKYQHLAKVRKSKDDLFEYIL